MTANTPPQYGWVFGHVAKPLALPTFDPQSPGFDRRIYGVEIKLKTFSMTFMGDSWVLLSVARISPYDQS